SDYQLELFGGTKKSNEKQDEKEKSESFIGTVMFYDAWLLPKHSSAWFCEDIINVHYQRYYKQERLPDGTEEPLPVKIAALNPELCFFLVLQGPEQYLSFIKEVLEEALVRNGIGGKTSVGYGRFIVQKTQEELKRKIQEEIEGADTEGLLKLYNSHKNDSRFSGDFFNILDKIKAEGSLEPLYLKFHPLKYVVYAIENGRANTEKAFRGIVKNTKNNFTNFEKQHPELKLSETKEAGIILQHVRDKLHITGEEIEQNSLLKKLTCTWEDIKIDENNIDQILAELGKSSWPPVSGLKKAINNSSLLEEDKAIALMEVEDYLKN
ncbi:MAG: type III-B CRISPR module RAMP protein Cmr6, partial [Desulfobacula sp.]|nr:type III-B CRISPR module RAMP protein Cmr6 [Desulfobacula sp.]